MDEPCGVKKTGQGAETAKQEGERAGMQSELQDEADDHGQRDRDDADQQREGSGARLTANPTRTADEAVPEETL